MHDRFSMAHRMAQMRVALFACTALGLPALAGPISAAQDGKSIWAGVYTTEQAQRGREQFEVSCGHCHGDDLGGGDGPALVGAGFMRNWLEDSLQSLYDHVRREMPGDFPGSLSEDQAVDLTGFLLQANGLPAGSEPLEPDPRLLAGIMIFGKDGPGSVPNFSMVQVVGCLSRVDGDWILARGTEPSRTRDGAASAADAEAMAGVALGSHTLELMDASYLEPENLDGQKVLAKGLLIRQPEQRTKVNVTGLAGMGVPCEP